MAEEVEEELLKPGQRFGDYTVVRRLGKGGMGVVYLVEHPTDGQFAVKIVDPKAANDNGFVRRFAHEGAFAMKIRHPNLIAVYDMGQDPETGYYYLVMDYMPGGDVFQRLKERGRFPIDEAVLIVEQVANALAEAHEHGVIHRDIKPSNIMFDADGTPKLADLGVAKFSDAGQTMLTMANVMIGTPAYMAPEQIMDSHGVDARADIYSLGVVFFEMLTGRRPNEGMTVLQIVAQAVEGKSIPDIRTLRPEVPGMIAQLLNMMCMPDRNKRIDSALQVVAMFGRILSRNRRPPSVEGPIDEVAEEAEASSAPAPLPAESVSKPRKFSPRLLAGVGIGLVVVAVASVCCLCLSRPQEKKPESPSAPALDIRPLPKQVGESGHDEVTDELAKIREYEEELAASKKTVPVTAPAATEEPVKTEAAKPASVPQKPPASRPSPAASKSDLHKAGEVMKVALPRGVEIELVYCPPGTFKMGSPTDEMGRSADEEEHTVTLTRGFWIGKYEVTCKQWQSVMGRLEKKTGGDALPVSEVTWEECVQFCSRVGKEFRLPTEAEWEYACRAGGTAAIAGVGRLAEMGWYGENGHGVLHAGGEKAPNDWGLFDCHGNLWEWCADKYGAYSGAAKDPQGPEDGSARVMRGGWAGSLSRSCRSASRGRAEPTVRLVTCGFRLCRSE